MKGERKTFRVGDEVLVRPKSYQKWYEHAFKKPITMEIHAYILDVFTITFINKLGLAYLRLKGHKLMVMCPIPLLDHYQEDMI